MVQPYTAAELAALLGEGYVLRHTLEELHHSPQGEQHPYVYALFQRTASSERSDWQYSAPEPAALKE